MRRVNTERGRRLIPPAAVLNERKCKKKKRKKKMGGKMWLGAFVKPTSPPLPPLLPLPLLQINAGLASDNIGLGKACSHDLTRMCTAAAAILLDVRGTFSPPPWAAGSQIFFYFFGKRHFDCCHKENCERYSGARSSSSQYSLSPRIHLLSRLPFWEVGVGGRWSGGRGLRDPTRILKYRGVHSTWSLQFILP